MTLAEVETFLSIVATRSITRTAELLFLSQPTISHRLSSLENELGFELVVRRKGHKTIELTPKGEEFISIAERWSSLWKETMAIRNSDDRYLLTIGCTDENGVLVFNGFKGGYRLQTEGGNASFRLDGDTDVQVQLTDA